VGLAANPPRPAGWTDHLVEEYFEIELGVWGQLAAGGGGILTPAPQDNSLRYQRRAQRIGAIGREDTQRSERLVVITMAAWEQSIAGSSTRPAPSHWRSAAQAKPGPFDADPPASAWASL
jgi:hypothetical protein